MANEGDSYEDSSSDAASHPFFFKRVGPRQACLDDVVHEAYVREVGEPSSLPTAEGASQEGCQNNPSLSPAQFQKMVMKALYECTASLIGSSSGVLQHAGGPTSGMQAVSTVDPGPSCTWSELTYRKAEARRNKKPDMMRTSAGEQSDSQEDFPLPENATTEQRTLRTRRLNRWRAKKARDLTSNRKAVKKLPYVIHVDGISKPKGIHRQKWKVAVRGQCGRLDPTMDNINHHPKNVVDSMWHALEKEWEFEGFTHKAREMFERSATKFMRNKKMQLKYKCQKNVDGPKPDDVSPIHWKKIVALTKKTMTEQDAGTSSGSEREGKKICSEEVIDRNQVSRGRQLDVHLEKHAMKSGNSSKGVLYKPDDARNCFPTALTGGRQDGCLQRNSYVVPRSGEAVALEEEDVDAQIKILRSQLLWLEQSKKTQHDGLDDLCEVALQVTPRKGIVTELRPAMKENVAPPAVFGENDSTTLTKSWEKAKQIKQEGESVRGGGKHVSAAGKEKGEGRILVEQTTEVNRAEMECGDLISMVATIRGKEEDVAKGVLMGIAGSKLARKVIPKGWCSVKVNSFTASGAMECCPFPAGWKDQIKYKTVRDADGRIILWPTSQVHI